ncbi:HNH endonuclease [Solidesulfovibrio magneticus]|uniref:HNH nuclease domain-containing protein n=1 Tax=Solidesulfovibrio magneticus (strain ATCC 700980 / DSM 13731 / RS-1) TaxID=573370 RepID=C4XKK7_SOLM1|nr:HNH endonuclease [Solidesulfovibrio magneticus]BAH76947.1 hypothetical protein DMR_34560 [Solidesulfovibrio magneticus RS-1]
MTYWWVNQNQTAEHEILGGYLWSPKYKKDGRNNYFYNTMRQIQVGDIVFSYYSTRIQHLGIATAVAASCPKPDEFGSTGESWNIDGWIVPVKWTKIPNPFRPKELINELRPHLPGRYSPIQKDTGDGLQGVYLTLVPDSMADVLMRQIGDLAPQVKEAAAGQVEDDGPIQRVDDAIEKIIRISTSIDSTEKEALVKARKGQGRFRKNLESIEPGCRITGVTDSKLLKASHIKPWRSCASNEERLDGYNGLLLTPTIDHLFDRGLIGFNDNGDLLVSARIAADQLMRLGIDSGQLLNVGRFSKKQADYLAYHRANVFL